MGEVSHYDDKYMEIAFKEAQKAQDAGEVPIGCCFVTDNQVIATGRNEVNLTKNATRHAEMVAVDQVIANNKQESG